MQMEIEVRSSLRTAPASLLMPFSYRFVKRYVDVVVALLLLLFFSPLILILTLLIKLESPGPVLYRQQRIGLGGKPFQMLKFRSMRVGNDSSAHREYVQRLIRENISPEDLGTQSLKLQADPRITWIGRFIRKFSFDELPQLLNVLWGEMSLVGPRPSVAYEYELYKDWQNRRLAVLPGLTGLWQVTAHNQVSFDDMVRIDLAYIRSMSLRLDVIIMLRTPLEMIWGKGSG